MLGGICCGLVAVVTFAFGEGTMLGLSIGVAMTGKFLISMTFAIAYLYTAELFPTKVRNVAVGTASTFARVGSISAPYIVDLLVRITRLLFESYQLYKLRLLFEYLIHF